MGGQETSRLLINRDRCEGHGLCEQSAPELVHLNDEAELIIDVDEIGLAQKPMAEAAVQACPVAALSITAWTRTLP